MGFLASTHRFQHAGVDILAFFDGGWPSTATVPLSRAAAHSP